LNVDERQSIYADLHKGQLSEEEQRNRRSASTILRIIRSLSQPKSVLDVGCGLGTWLDVARGVFDTEDVVGIEGDWSRASSLVINPTLVHVADLEQGFDLHRRFDLAICLEVAEHLSAGAAPRLVSSLVKHSDAILFSAAIPYQGGDHHVNEQFLPYWEELFDKHDYLAFDPIRRKIWNDDSVLWWLRQNAVLFINVAKHLVSLERAMSIVHPEVYMARVEGVTQTGTMTWPHPGGGA
jgi:SAM-dependent methyltransferase